VDLIGQVFGGIFFFGRSNHDIINSVRRPKVHKKCT
jgi:hypothetical protein